mmetsp:Transcript_862/g.2043  ORF Transcript_862/g.2043 Transcript_862/m.2043 type:complete len:234 (-) Transcript_862:78-779(-)
MHQQQHAVAAPTARHVPPRERRRRRRGLDTTSARATSRRRSNGGRARRGNRAGRRVRRELRRRARPGRRRARRKTQGGAEARRRDAEETGGQEQVAQVRRCQQGSARRRQSVAGRCARQRLRRPGAALRAHGGANGGPRAAKSCKEADGRRLRQPARGRSGPDVRAALARGADQDGQEARGGGAGCPGRLPGLFRRFALGRARGGRNKMLPLSNKDVREGRGVPAERRRVSRQ